MGWRIGDRLVVAPTGSGSAGTAEQAVVAGFEGCCAVLLAAAISQDLEARALASGGRAVLLSAEGINLSRSMPIWGLDLRLADC